jgi:hypothetical protein
MNRQTTIVLAAVTLIGACRHSSAPPSRPVSTWMEVPSREPERCDAYKLVDGPEWPPEDRVKVEHECRASEEFRQFLVQRQRCQHDSDCVVVKVGCPIAPGGVPVSASQARAVSLKRDEVVRKYHVSLNDDCNCKCLPVEQTVCREGLCMGAW